MNLMIKIVKIETIKPINLPQIRRRIPNLVSARLTTTQI